MVKDGFATEKIAREYCARIEKQMVKDKEKSNVK